MAPTNIPGEKNIPVAKGEAAQPAPKLLTGPPAVGVLPARTPAQIQHEKDMLAAALGRFFANRLRGDDASPDGFKKMLELEAEIRKGIFRQSDLEKMLPAYERLDNLMPKTGKVEDMADTSAIRTLASDFDFSQFQLTQGEKNEVLVAISKAIKQSLVQNLQVIGGGIEALQLQLDRKIYLPYITGAISTIALLIGKLESVGEFSLVKGQTFAKLGMPSEAVFENQGR